MAEHLHRRSHISAARVFSFIALRTCCTPMKVHFAAVDRRRGFIPPPLPKVQALHYRKARAVGEAVPKWIPAPHLPVKCMFSRDSVDARRRLFYREQFRRRQKQLRESRVAGTVHCAVCNGHPSSLQPVSVMDRNRRLRGVLRSPKGFALTPHPTPPYHTCRGQFSGTQHQFIAQLQAELASCSEPRDLHCIAFLSCVANFLVAFAGEYPSHDCLQLQLAALWFLRSVRGKGIPQGHKGKPVFRSCWMGWVPKTRCARKGLGWKDRQKRTLGSGAATMVMYIERCGSVVLGMKMIFGAPCDGVDPLERFPGLYKVQQLANGSVTLAPSPNPLAPMLRL